MKLPRILVVSGFFDWFSGYQEIGLVRALAKEAEVRVLASDRVNPLFSDAHLASIGMDRRYRAGRTIENGVEILRVPTREIRSMVWSAKAPAAVTAADPDGIVQVMPGQVLPLAATLSPVAAPRAVLYGDNAAMYAAVPARLRSMKRLAFSLSKGNLYRLANRGATAIYGYTPDTLERLRAFSSGRTMELLPLAYDASVFGVDGAARAAVRAELGARPDSLVIIAPGKVQRQKRMETVVAAAEQIAAEGRDVHVVFAGIDDSPAGRALQQRAARSPLGSRVHTLSFVDAHQLARLFNGADVGAWPAMPAITIQQAMGTGLPVCIPKNEFTSHLLRADGSGAWISSDGDLPSRLAAAVRAAAPVGPSTERARRAAGNAWLSTSAAAAQILEGLGLGDCR